MIERPVNENGNTKMKAVTMDNFLLKIKGILQNKSLPQFYIDGKKIEFKRKKIQSKSVSGYIALFSPMIKVKISIEILENT